MDDSVVLEPMLGDRPWKNTMCLEEQIHRCWGPHAINEEKKEEEGEWPPSQLIWGLEMVFPTPEDPEGNITLPEPKRIKGQYLLALPSLQPGSRVVSYKLAQEVVGCAGHWCTAQPRLWNEMPALYRMLTQDRPGSGEVDPTGSEAQKRRAWEDWDEALEFLRYLLEDDEAWRTTFSAGFEAHLAPRELLALPGQAKRTCFIGGDATLERVGAVDHHAKVYMLGPAAEMIRYLRERIDPEDDELMEIIAVAEMITFIALAALRAPKWQEVGHTIIIRDR